MALPQKSKMHLFGRGGFSLMPQRGYGLQPRVAASATLGTSKKEISTATRLRRFLSEHKADATALRLRTRSLSLPRVAEAATLGWRPMPRWGISALGWSLPRLDLRRCQRLASDAHHRLQTALHIRIRSRPG